MTNIVLGASIAALFTVIGYFFKASQEKNKDLKKALYYLLEIWHRVSPTIIQKDPIEEIDKVADHFKEQLGITEFPFNRSQIQELLKQVIIERNQNLLADLSDLQTMYQESMMHISTSDPIFAYKIGGPVKISNYLDTLKVSNGHLKNHNDKLDDNVKKIVEPFQESSSLAANMDALVNIENDLKTLALRINFISYFKILHIIWRRRKQLLSDDSKNITKEIEQYLMPLLEQINSMQDENKENTNSD